MRENKPNAEYDYDAYGVVAASAVDDFVNPRPPKESDLIWAAPVGSSQMDGLRSFAPGRNSIVNMVLAVSVSCQCAHLREAEFKQDVSDS